MSSAGSARGAGVCVERWWATRHRVEQKCASARAQYLSGAEQCSHVLTSPIVTDNSLVFCGQVGVIWVAGRGPAPKPKGSRARRNKEPQILRIITAQPVEQPSLPVIEQVVLDENGKPRKKRFTWPTVTRRWWKMWGESPLSAEYTETDWSFLLDTAYLHALYWKGDFRVAGELRLRVAKFGATPEDRARLRIQFAVADNLEDDADTADGDAAPVSARARRRQKKLRAV